MGGQAEDLSLCFIHRATRDGDPWSGHMAFPGGRASEGDPTPRAAAERETFEEIGLQLAHAEYLGSLPELRIRRHGVETGGVLSPFVFYAGSESPRLKPNEEVAAAYWIPLRYLWNSENCTTIEFNRAGTKIAYPGIRHADQIIWGITYWILDSFAQVIAVPLPCNQGAG